MVETQEASSGIQEIFLEGVTNCQQAISALSKWLGGTNVVMFVSAYIHLTDDVAGIAGKIDILSVEMEVGFAFIVYGSILVFALMLYSERLIRINGLARRVHERHAIELLERFTIHPSYMSPYSYNSRGKWLIFLAGNAALVVNWGIGVAALRMLSDCQTSTEIRAVVWSCVAVCMVATALVINIVGCSVNKIARKANRAEDTSKYEKAGICIAVISIMIAFCIYLFLPDFRST